MFKILFNKIFPKRKGNKRAISPVIATILLIALTVSAAAIVYFVVVPLLKGQGELVLMSSMNLLDTNDDGYFDTVEADLYNIGTEGVTVEEGATVIIHSELASMAPKFSQIKGQLSINSESFTWGVTSDREYIPQEEQTLTISATNDSDQIDPLSQYEIIISYSGRQLTTGIQLSEFTTGSGEGEDPPEDPLEYLSSALVLRTPDNDPSRCRGTFPVASGYSPRLWFLLGIYRSGTGGLCGNTNDYIAADGFGNAEDYRPYIGIDDEFSTQISSHTNYKAMPYNDSGNYPGCVTFTGSTFDGGDTLNWPQRGVVYMFAYIYNPTEEAMDLDISVQSDDSFILWVNSEEIMGTYSTSQWNKWVTADQSITFNPGYNIITIRTTDNGGNWDAQTLFWDTGDTDDIGSLLNVWPLALPTSTYW